MLLYFYGDSQYEKLNASLALFNLVQNFHFLMVIISCKNIFIMSFAFSVFDSSYPGETFLMEFSKSFVAIHCNQITYEFINISKMVDHIMINHFGFTYLSIQIHNELKLG